MTFMEDSPVSDKKHFPDFFPEPLTPLVWLITNTYMFIRLLLAVILSALGAQCASAGVLVCAEQAPEAVNSLSMPVEDDLPLAPIAVEQGDFASDMTVTSSNTSGSMVAFGDWASSLGHEAPLAETLRVWSSTLPTCPFLEAKLKPA